MNEMPQDRGGKATSQGHSLGGLHPLNVHVCPDYMRGTNAAGTRQLRACWAVTPESTSQPGAMKSYTGFQDVSVKCAHILQSVTFSHRPFLLLRCVSHDLSLLPPPPHFGREIKILLRKEKHTRSAGQTEHVPRLSKTREKIAKAPGIPL